MLRTRRNYALDTRITDVLGDAAKKAGYSSETQFIEATLFNILKLSGNLETDTQPLPEQRGGSRTRRTKTKK
jgi:hypothetical protein